MYTFKSIEKWLLWSLTWQLKMMSDVRWDEMRSRWNRLFLFLSLLVSNSSVQCSRNNLIRGWNCKNSDQRSARFQMADIRGIHLIDFFTHPPFESDWDSVKKNDHQIGFFLVFRMWTYKQWTCWLTQCNI